MYRTPDPGGSGIPAGCFR